MEKKLHHCLLSKSISEVVIFDKVYNNNYPPSTNKYFVIRKKKNVNE